MFFLFFFFKQKTAYEMRISDWSSDVCSSDLLRSLVLFLALAHQQGFARRGQFGQRLFECGLRAMAAGQIDLQLAARLLRLLQRHARPHDQIALALQALLHLGALVAQFLRDLRSEEHTSELQSLMRISYAVFCLKKKKKT